jgi:hypothetical protein
MDSLIIYVNTKDLSSTPFLEANGINNLKSRSRTAVNSEIYYFSGTGNSLVVARYCGKSMEH